MTSPCSSSALGIGGGSGSLEGDSMAACPGASLTSMGLDLVCSSPGGPGVLPDSSKTGGRITSRLASIRHLLPTFRGSAGAVKVEDAEIPEGSRKRLVEPGLLGGTRKRFRESVVVPDQPSGILAGPLVGPPGEEVADVEERIASPVVVEGSSDDKGKDAVPEQVSEKSASEGQFSLNFLGQWAQEDLDRANERARLIYSWYGEAEAAREENIHLRERLEAQSGTCKVLERYLADSWSREDALREVVERRNSRIDDLARELEDVKAQLARAQGIAMDLKGAASADVASSSGVAAVGNERRFGAALAARLLWLLDVLGRMPGFDLKIFERGGYSDQELDAFIQEIPEDGSLPPIPPEP